MLLLMTYQRPKHLLNNSSQCLEEKTSIASCYPWPAIDNTVNEYNSCSE